MNNRALTLSILMAVVAVFFVQSYVSSVEEEAKKKFGTEVLVLKAKRDVKEQETIDETALKFELMPERFLEPNAISFGKKNEDSDTAKARRSFVGSVALVPLKAGEQITLSKVTDPSVRTGLSPQVAPGKRAFAIPVSELTGVSKLIKPGDRVDLVGVLDVGGGKENRVVKTLLQDIIVLSTGRNITHNDARIVELDRGKVNIRSLSEDTSFNTVTLELDPIQVQMMALLVNGDHLLTLSLRNNDDTDRIGLGPMNLGDVIGNDLSRSQGRRPSGR